MPREFVEPVVLTPEQQAEEDRLNALAKAADDARKLKEAQDKAKRDEMKALYATVKDPHYAAWKMNEGKTNPAEYLTEALESLDDTKLKEFAKKYTDDVAVLAEAKVQDEIDKLLSKIDVSALPNNKKNHPKVKKYLDKQAELLVQLDVLLGE